jgi:hypothetical protein
MTVCVYQRIVPPLLVQSDIISIVKMSYTVGNTVFDPLLLQSLKENVRNGIFVVMNVAGNVYLDLIYFNYTVHPPLHVCHVYLT